MSLQQHATANASSEELAVLSLAFAPSLAENDVRALLKYLNGLTPHRFTGVYRFEPGWVMSVGLWDRENPLQELGANVKMKESYCWLTGSDGACCVIEDATLDPRLSDHAARDSVRSYVGVLLRDRHDQPWGTLCHFDFRPQVVNPETIVRLKQFRPLVEEMLVRDRPARWEPDAPS